jgi:hypothetical protein
MAVDHGDYLSKPIHEILHTLKGQCILQTNGVDIAIPFLAGNPGLGKTAFVLKMCKDNGWNLMHLHFALSPIEEISGIPDFVKITKKDGTEVQGTQWSYPEIMSRLEEIADIPDENGNKVHTVLLMDDMHICSPAHFSLGYEMFTERTLRSNKFPDNVSFILAGNTSSKAGSKTMFSAIVNRCSMYHTHADYNYWKENYALPHKVNHKIISFLSKEQYKKHFHGAEMVNEPWASPRSWTRLGNILSPLEEVAGKTLSNKDLIYYAQSHVGREAAADFATYYSIYSKVEVDKVFAGQKKIVIPDNQGDMYVYIMASINEFFDRYVKENDKKSNSSKSLNEKDRVLNVLGDIFVGISDQSGGAEISVAGMKEFITIENALKFKVIYHKLLELLEKKNPKVYNRINKGIMNV